MQHVNESSGFRPYRPSRRNFLKTVGVGLASLQSGRSLAADAGGNRPNVLLVITDDQGYFDLSCHGNKHLHTPNLDRLHAESLRLTNFHVSPTCAPTRAALLTGRYNNRTGVWHTVMGRSILRRDEITMGDYFSQGGYHTGIFGKWHLGDNYPYRPQDRGFQEVLIHGGGGVGQTPDYWGNNYQDDTYELNGSAVPFPGYCTDVWFDGAQRFMEARRDGPFFCYLPTNIPHSPYIVPKAFQEPFEGKGLEPNQVAFYGMLKHFDGRMGQLLDYLDSSGLAENTILIYMTDNGTAAGDHGTMRGAKGSEYEGGHRVPCFIRWPQGGLGGGQDLAQLTAHVDLLPTLLDYCGLAPDPSMPFDGMSLRPWFSDISRPARDRAIVVDSQRIEDPEKWRKSAVMEGSWRLVNGAELYDIALDPSQKEDVVAAHPEVVTRLRDYYEAWWSSTSVDFDSYCPIVLGGPGNTMTHLTCHDWHAPIEQLPWNQPHIREGKVGNGFWAVEVAQAGQYRIALRRWPRECKAPIRSSVDGGTALSIAEARVNIAGFKASMAVAEGDEAALFDSELAKGIHQLHTTFVEEDGTERGAYYVEVKFLDA